MLSVRLQVVALGLGGSAWASHTPAPLERGDWDAAFYLVMGDLSGDVSPPEREDWNE